MLSSFLKEKTEVCEQILPDFLKAATAF
jgi:hypothetical protein